jgi:hypothetical protein
MPRGLNVYREAQQQGQLWTPQVLSRADLGAWWKLSDKDGNVQRSAAGLTCLLDKSGNGNHLTPNTGNPVYGEIALGGAAPGVLFSAANTGLRRASGVALANPVCAFLVAQVANTTETRLVSLSGSAGSSDAGFYIPIIYNSQALKSYAAGAFRGVSPTVPLNRPFIGRSLWSTTQSTVDLNARLGTPNTIAYPSGSAAIIGLGIGANAEANGAGHVISEALLVPGYLMNMRLVNLIDGYLAWDWAMRGAVALLIDLNPANPFKNRPPLLGD